MPVPRSDSFNAVGKAQLDRLWRAVHGVAAPAQALRVFDELVPAALVASTWPSFISDDHTPYELSLLLGARTAQVRIMAEPLPLQGPVTLARTIEAGRALATRLRREFGVDVSRLERIADLFLPDDPQGPFALWLAASLDGEGTPSFKLYVNPAVRGAHQAPRLVEEALQRLGLDGAWATTTRVLRRGPELDELRFFSVDLDADAVARAKVYAFHHDATPTYLAEVVGSVPRAEPARVHAFCRALVGGDGVLRAARQPGTCLAFVAGSSLPKTGTVHVPIRAFAPDDAVAHQRVLDAMAAAEIVSPAFQAAIRAMASRPLETGSGLIAWAAIRTGGAEPMVNVYVAPKVLCDEPSHPESAPCADLDAPETVVARYESHDVTAHPYFARLAREPLDMRALTLLVLNIREAITRDFARRLSAVIARVEEDELRSILAKQLDDELGNGDPSRTHKILFERFVAGLTEWTPPTLGEAELAPGRAFAEVQEELYLRRSPYEGLGATLVMEVLGKQGDIAMGNQLRRKQDALPAPILEWLTLHEALEVDHVNESFDLARRVPRGPKARLAARGASELGAAAWAFLDGMYRVAYTGR
jgi:DMATS type aromatic prenyltransferase